MSVLTITIAHLALRPFSHQVKSHSLRWTFKGPATRSRIASGPLWPFSREESQSPVTILGSTGCGADHPSPLLPQSGHQSPLPLGEHQQIPLCASICARAGTPRGVTLKSTHTPQPGPGSGLGGALLSDQPALFL